MAVLILVGFALWGILSYFQHNKGFFLLAVFLVISSCINLIPSSIISEDLSLAMALTAIIYDLAHGVKVFSTKRDPVGKLILILLFYCFFEAIWTAAQGAETFIYALKVYRRDLFYVYYFVFKQLSLSDIMRVCKPLLTLTIVGGVLYYLQFASIHMLSNFSDNTVVAGGGYSRYSNTPMLSIPFLVFFIVKRDNVNIWVLLFFVGLLIMPMSRGNIIASIIAIAYYIVKRGKFNSYRGIAIKLLIPFLLFSPVLIYRFIQDNDRGTAAQDIRKALSFSDFSEFDYGSGGTFTFRIALALERFNYMVNNPETLLTGVGVIHEQSPNNKFEFYIGTNLIYMDGVERRQTIDTEDIAYVSHTFRYGLIYLLLFILFIRSCFVRLKSGMKKHAIGAVGFVFLFILVINSLSSDVFSFLRFMFIPLLNMAIIKTCDNENLTKLYPIK